MQYVEETHDVFPFDNDVRTVKRDERKLLGGPVMRGPKLWQDLPPVEVVHFHPDFEPIKFAPPRGVYESGNLRIEWQTMNFRQPFYHRNADVDELSYQIAGERTLMTELGTVELRQGDFSRIPRGVAHDNYGREQSHLLFYVPAPVEELTTPAKTTEMTMPPFPGWEQGPQNELITECLGGPEHDVAISEIDERLLLEHAEKEEDRITIFHPDEEVAGTTWLYRSRDVMIGRVNLDAGDGRHYRRHLDVQEIQYQISGHRTLVTQRGAVDLEPGDLVQIPVGTAFTSIGSGPTSYISLVTRLPAPRVTEAAKTGRPVTLEDVENIRVQSA